MLFLYFLVFFSDVSRKRRQLIMQSFITISLSIGRDGTKFNLTSYNGKLKYQRIFDDSTDIEHAPQKLEIPVSSENIKMTNVMTRVSSLNKLLG